jgi:heavy metal translocating P-type ATPase
MPDLMMRKPTLLAIALTTLCGGGIAFAINQPHWASQLWALGTGITALYLCLVIMASFKQGTIGLDLIAAMAMIGSVLLDEMFAGNVIAVMFAGGHVLEAVAQARARREMTTLMTRTPQRTTRICDHQLSDINIHDVQIGDHLLIRSGDVIPVDGTLLSDSAHIDESIMTGEAITIMHRQGDVIISGTLNQGGAFDMRARTDAAGSSYAAIVRMVEDAERRKAPMARLADRFALGFFIITLVLACTAWFISGDPLRALAVFVVATPCPLILAVPVAIVSGMSRCASLGLLVKNGGALEALAETQIVLFDKTGTLTHGRPLVSSIHIADGFSSDDVVMAAGSLAQGSSHVISVALAEEAKQRLGILHHPEHVREWAGEGISGDVCGRHIHIGTFAFVARHVRHDGWFARGAEYHNQTQGLITAIGIDGVLAGLVVFHDARRAEVPVVVKALRRHGILRLGMITGDRLAVAQGIVEGLDFDTLATDVSPAGKVDAVLDAKKSGIVAMVGDGVNDAPALAAAHIGIALGARGAAASSEAADAILLVDRLDPLPEAFSAARRAFVIARQSVWAGLILSGFGMMMAACGYLSPVAGAVAQELIDIAVIANALRALGGRNTTSQAL